MPRILKKGEIIQAGDQYDASYHYQDNAVWKPVPSHMIGQQARDPSYSGHTIYRRFVQDTLDFSAVRDCIAAEAKMAAQKLRLSTVSLDAFSVKLEFMREAAKSKRDPRTHFFTDAVLLAGTFLNSIPRADFTEAIKWVEIEFATQIPLYTLYLLIIADAIQNKVGTSRAWNEISGWFNEFLAEVETGAKAA